MKIKMADLAARHFQVADQVEAAVIQVLRSGQYIGGPVVQTAENFAASSFDVAGAVGVNSGTDALMVALSVVGVRPGHEVIIPALSYFATAGAVMAIGGHPVIVDVLSDGCLDPDAAKRAVTSQTRAVVPVHLFGNYAQSPQVDVPIVDDAAQAFGGSPPRATGILTALSTYPTKNWAGAGDGGFILGNDLDLLVQARRLANHGASSQPHLHEAINGVIGRNTRLDTIQAAVLLAHADGLPVRIARRQEIGRRYDQGLPQSIRSIPRDPGSPVHVYAIRTANRDRLRSQLASEGIESTIYYPRPLHQQPAIMEHNGAVLPHGGAPVAEQMCRELMALPIHAGLSDADVDTVIDALNRL